MSSISAEFETSDDWFDDILGPVVFVLLDPAIGSAESGVDWSVLIAPRDATTLASRVAAITTLNATEVRDALRETHVDNRLMVADLVEVEEGTEARIELSFIELEEQNGAGCLAVGVVPLRLFKMLSILADGRELKPEDLGLGLSEYLGSGSFSAV